LRPTSKSNREREKWRGSETKTKEGRYTTTPKSFYPESSLNILIDPDLGTVGKGSAQHVPRGAVATPGLDFGQSEMGDPSVFG